MINLPGWMIPILTNFAPVFYSVSAGRKVEVLVVGAILATGKRTVSAVLHVMGLSQSPNYAQYHQVLNRAVWSRRDASEVLLRMLLKAFSTAREPLVFGIDETLERRWGAKIAARDLPRSRSLEQKPFRESQWLEVDLPDVADGDCVDATRVGVALFHGSRSLRALLLKSTTNGIKSSRIGHGRWWCN